MSTRKTTAAATKVENAATSAATAAATTPTDASSADLTEQKEMGANVSTSPTVEGTAPKEAVATIESSTLKDKQSDTESGSTCNNKEAIQKVDNAKIGNEPKRITRNSPLLLTSPTAGKRELVSQQRGSAAAERAESEPTNSESEDGGSSVSSVTTKRSTTQIRGRKSLKEAAREAAKDESSEKLADGEVEVEKVEIKESAKEISKDIKEAKDTSVTITKELKEAKDTKSLKESESAGGSANTTSMNARPTRKAVAHELVVSTRVTRNRQTGQTASRDRSETPPAITVSTRGRRGAVAAKKMSLPQTQTHTDSLATKRKRSVEEIPHNTRASSVEPGVKLIKIEIKDENESIIDEELVPTTSAELDDNVKVKQELLEQDETATEASTAVTVAITTSASTRGRGRWPGRKPQLTVNSNPTPISPSTRSTRQNKVSSPSLSVSSSTNSSVGSVEPKRRRVGSVTRSSSTNLLKTSVTSGSGAHAPDEDSKDSMASSMDDLHDIKLEKITSEVDETDGEMEEKVASSVDTAIVDPLDVQIEATNRYCNKSDTSESAGPEVTHKSVEGINDAAASGSEKAVSLSPELVSEGVSEISVKQFYKKPKFLENNLGIEQDPKLGEIVQKASTAEKVEEATVNKDRSMNDEQETIEVEENDKKDSSFEEDVGSTSHFSPLVVEEDEIIEELEETEEEKATVMDVLITEDVEALQQPEDINGDNDVDRLVIEEVEEEDDVTLAESDAISMDNNPSLHEDAPDAEEREDRGEEGDTDREKLMKINVVGTEERSKSKHGEIENGKTTKIECDKEKAKLKTDRDIKNEIKMKSFSEDDQEEVLVVGKVKHAIKNGSSLEASTFNSDDITFEAADDDAEVLAKIEAELKKIKELEERKLKVSDDHIEENKENVVLVVTKELAEGTEDTVVKSVEEAPNKTFKEESDEKDILFEKDEDEEGVLVIDQERESASETEIAVEEDEIAEPAEKMEVDEMASIISAGTATGNVAPTKSSSSTIFEKDDDGASHKSGQSTDTNSWVTLEPDTESEEIFRQKEQHLQNLGLLTHKAAEKRRQENIQNSAAAAEATRASHGSKRNGKGCSATSGHHEYTGTLKTVIKLNRNPSGNAATAGNSNNGNGRKNQGQHHPATKEQASGSGSGSVRRQSLKMTFQKGRGRGQGAHTDRSTADQQTHGEDAYYTIQNENEGAQKTTSSTKAAVATNISTGMLEHTNVVAQTHGRKTYNRSNNTSHSNNSITTTTNNSSNSEGQDASAAASSSHILNKKDEKEEILIPEKASSFKFHPGRLCEDQCFYCSGKFGLYDTPCHVGQIKSLERQQNILANEEKLTVDNCLCDACFRHVDRRANVPSYKKRLSAPGHLEGANSAGSSNAAVVPASNLTLIGDASTTNTNLDEDDAEARKCLVPECTNPAAHSLRRKCIRKSVKKFLLNFDLPSGSPYVWLCQSHYNAVIQCSGCVLCKRRLGKNHMYHITSDTDRLEKALSEMGIPVQLGIGTAVCKLCRYFANLLMKPPDSTKSQKAEFVKNYRKRLLQFHNIHDGSNDPSEAEIDEEDSNGGVREGTETISPSKKGVNSNNSKPPRKRGSSSSKEDSTKTSPPSPNGSSGGSSVECLGDTVVRDAEAAAAASAALSALTAARTEQQQQMMLENDVLVDYDVPMVSTDSNSSSEPASPGGTCTGAGTGTGTGSRQMSKLMAILQQSSGNSSSSGVVASKEDSATKSSVGAADISNVLRANPNISMRELFPGEEDLGLQFKAPFGSSNSQRTPEGWTRVQTFLQYDAPTRRLWEELQKPYGNQSSFLRHLILLEKYFRNGDLLLSPHASSNASVYTQTVRQRLTSYDQGYCGGAQSAKPVKKAGEENVDANTCIKDAQIPTVEITVEDDEVEETAQEEQNPSLNKLPANPNVSMELRSRSVSVDKLTKQLSNNAVTIIARPKETATGNPIPATTPKILPDVALSQASLLKDKDKDKDAFVASNTTTLGSTSANLAAASAAAAAALSSATAGSMLATSSSSSNSRSILKSNLLGINKSVEILPISSATTTSKTPTSIASNNNSSSSGNSTTTESKQQKILEVANKLLVNSAAAAASAQQKATLLTSPPELVSLHRRSTGSNNSSSSLLNATATTSNPPPTNTTASLMAQKRPQLLAKANAATGGRPLPPNVVILPDTLTPQERHQSKSWRPTLMPVEENQHLMHKGGPLYQTADGRRLPALVQVQSGGKPFLISIFDYNRMCILRREKLLRDQMLLKNNKQRHEAKQQQQPQQPPHQQPHHQQQQQHHQQQNSQQHVQKNVGPLAAPNLQHFNNNNNKNIANLTKTQQLMAQQQLLQLQMIQLQKQQQATAALKAATTAGRYAPIAPKPPTTATVTTASVASMPPSTAPHLTNVAAGGAFAGPMGALLANVLNNANVSGSGSPHLAGNASSWLWNNYPDAQQLLLNGGAGAGPNKLPQLLPKPQTASSNINTNSTTATKQQQQQQQQLLLDNALISKIPKSLTVIPQHKLMANSTAPGPNTSSGPGSSYKE